MTTATLESPISLTREQIEAKMAEQRRQYVGQLHSLHAAEMTKAEEAVAGMREREEALRALGIEPDRVFTPPENGETNSETEANEYAAFPAAQIINPKQYTTKTTHIKEAVAIVDFAKQVGKRGFTMKDLYAAKLSVDNKNKDVKQRLADEVYGLHQYGFLTQTPDQRDGHNVYTATMYLS